MTQQSCFIPALTAENNRFWTGGADGELLIMRCLECDLAIHPPELLCPRCLSEHVQPAPVPGTGSIYSFTVNHQRWLPDLAVPYTIAAVDIDGAAGVRITATVVGAGADEVAIGDRVSVVFQQVSDTIWVPQVERAA